MAQVSLELRECRWRSVDDVISVDCTNLFDDRAAIMARLDTDVEEAVLGADSDQLRVS